MKPDINTLKGIALTEIIGNETHIRYFPSSLLPDTPIERFIELFKVRAKWKFNEIEPYLTNIVDPGDTIEQLLAKYTRVNQTPNGKIYSSR